MRSVIVGVLSVLVFGCGGGRAQSGTAASPRATSGASTAPAAMGRVGSAAPPVLTQEVVALDAEDPALIVSPETGWVVIPSFHLGVAMPEGWYWSDAEEMLRLTSTSTRHTLDESAAEALRRGLQAVVNQYAPDDPRVAGSLIPSVRVLLLPGGLPAGARLAEDFCEATLLPDLARTFPDARIVGHEMLTLVERPSIRCMVEHTVTTTGGVILPARSEAVLAFGTSHLVMIVSVGPAGPAVGETLTQVLGTLRAL